MRMRGCVGRSVPELRLCSITLSDFLEIMNARICGKIGLELCLCSISLSDFFINGMKRKGNSKTILMLLLSWNIYLVQCYPDEIQKYVTEKKNCNIILLGL